MKKKVLYIGSDVGQNTKPGGTIGVDSELQRIQAVYTGRWQFEFASISPCSIDQFLRIGEQKPAPSIVHISSHGEEYALLFSDTDRTAAGSQVTIDVLKSALNIPEIEVIYLDACNSAELAKALEDTKKAVVAFEGKIGVRASERGSDVFHSRIANGDSIKEAFDALKALIRGVDTNAPTPVLVGQDEITRQPVRPPPPELIAKFFKHDPSTDDQGMYTINFGIRTHPKSRSDSIFACFFSNEDPFVAREYVTLIRRQNIGSGMNDIWHTQPSLECWECQHDFKVYCSYFDEEREIEAISSKVSDALFRGYENFPFQNDSIKSEIFKAIQTLAKQLHE